MSDRPLTIFLSAAEASGDAHAANLIRAIREAAPQTRFVGVAGDRMAEAGCEVLLDLTHRASMLGGALLRAGYYWRQVRRVRKAIRTIRPDLCIPVDSPAFNWHVAKAGRQAGAKVLYYIAPQVWAWAPGRVKKLARLTDRVACILPFEEEYLRQRGVHATFVGHPIFDGRLERPPSLPNLVEAWSREAWQVALLPGSRPAELSGHIGPLIEVAGAILARWPRSRCLFAVYTEAAAERVRRACLGFHPGRLDVVAGPRAAEEALSRSHFAAVGSGTVTVQTAYFGVPMVVFYKTGFFTRALYRLFGWSPRFVRTRYFSLVNILAGWGAVPELMPWAGDTRPLVQAVLEAMGELGHLVEMRRNLLALADPLRVPPPGSAAGNAAKIAMELLSR